MSEKRPDTMLMYGETGAGKTVQLGELAVWEFNHTGKVTSLVSADSGWDCIEDLVWTPEKEFGSPTPSGPVCIQAWNIQYLPNPFPVVVKLSEGAWPRLSQDGKKIILAAGKMSPEGLVACDGKRVVGQYALEGLSTMSAMFMQDHIRNQRKIAEDIVGDFSGVVEVETNGRVATETFKFGKSGRAHYGHVQDFILLDLVPRFATLPVARVVWTAHEAKGNDDISGIKDSVLGPATIGKAAVDKTAQKFGDTFHLVQVQEQVPAVAGKPATTQASYRAYYEKHPDSVLTRMNWPAKLSLPLSRVLELRGRFPGGFVPLKLTGGMGEFLDFKHSTLASPAPPT